MSASTKSENENKSVPAVDRAAHSVRRAIGRLVQLLGDEELAVARGAALALAGLGGAAVVGPLAAALPRARRPRHRAAIVAVLSAFHGEEKVAVLRAQTGALERETEPVLSIYIGSALSGVIAADLFPPRPSREIDATGSGDEMTLPLESGD